MIGRRGIAWVCRLGLVSGIGLCSSIPSATACGGGGVTSANGVVMGTQRIIMSARANGTTDMVVQVTVPKTTEDYGVIIPVPSEPTLDPIPVPSAEFASLDTATAPTIEISEEEGSGGIGCLCLLPMSGGDDDTVPRSGVTVSDQVTIGPVVAVSLTGDNADEVGKWMTEHGFQLRKGDAEILARYVGQGSYFIALRRVDSGARGVPTSVGVHYTLQGDHRKLSLGFTKIGAPEDLAFTVFVAAPQAVGPSSPFAALTLNDLDANWLHHNDYKGAVRTAVLARQSKAFVLESATPKTGIANYAPNIAKLMDDGAVVTRATTVVYNAQLSDDVMFAAPFAREIPNRRTAGLSRREARNASLSAFGALFFAHALRRRGRKR